MSKGADGSMERMGRYKKGGIVFLISVLLCLLCAVLTWAMTKDLYDQQAAERWSWEQEYAQISCFYPVSMGLSDFEFQSLHHSIASALQNASLEANENARLFVDAYSVSGTLTLASENAQVEVKAFGVSDSFFSFHPLQLKTGSYFDESMLMKDGVILDEAAAFLLYGSNDVVGKPIYIGQEQYYIRGVVALEEGYFEKKAGLTSSLCYVPMETLETYGSMDGSYTYEVVLPNSVEGFAKEIVTKAVNDTEGRVAIVENSSRFSLSSRKEILLDFGVRSMSRSGIIYPYWENIARAREDVCAMLFFIESISFFLAVGLFFWYLRIRLKERTGKRRGEYEKEKPWSLCFNLHAGNGYRMWGKTTGNGFTKAK